MTRINELRAALKPFAEAPIPEDWPEHRALLISPDHPGNPKTHHLLIAHVRDFRRAKALYEATAAEKEKTK